MAPKAKSTSTSGSANKGKAPSTSGTATPVSSVGGKDTSEALAAYGSGKPDKKAYDAEQEALKKEIDAIQKKLSAVKEKISLATKPSSDGDRRNVLRAELDSIRGQQADNKTSRGKILDQVQSLKEMVDKKIKDLQASKSKLPFKSVADVDAHIKKLESQVESGNLKLADEKRALQDISSAKRNRRVVESFQDAQASIDADRAKLDELRRQLDDPEAKAVSERFDAIKKELDQLKKEGDDAYAGRSKLFEERDSIQAQVNELYNKKRDSSQKYREQNDRYWAKVNEDRTRRAEKARTERAAEEARKKHEIAERIRDEAQVPAFQAQIEDCQTLIDYFSGKGPAPSSNDSPLSPKADIAGVSKLEIRQVDAIPEGSVVRKKKGEDEDNYFIGGKGKKGKKGGTKKEESDGPAAPVSATKANIPYGTLTALLSLSIPPPVSSEEHPRVVEDLKIKKAWFEANQQRTTAENVAKAEEKIKSMLGEKEPSKVEVTGEKPAEPAPTPQAGPVPDGAVDSPALETVDEALVEEATTI